MHRGFCPLLLILLRPLVAQRARERSALCKMSYVATQVLRPRIGWPDTTNWLKKVNVNDISFCVYVRTAVVSPCVISVNMKSNVVVFSANCINRFWILFIWFLFWCVPKTDGVWRRALVLCHWSGCTCVGNCTRHGAVSILRLDQFVFVCNEIVCENNWITTKYCCSPDILRLSELALLLTYKKYTLI